MATGNRGSSRLPGNRGSSRLPCLQLCHLDSQGQFNVAALPILIQCTRGTYTTLQLMHASDLIIYHTLRS
uniref:UDP-glucosyltransferase n=1 Tax=Solanum tuberosum TaxID=4113 RepID=M0ZTB5_SOLTU